MSDHFSIRGYKILVFDRRGPSLQDVMNDPTISPLSRRQIREVALQVVKGVSCTFSSEFKASASLLTKPSDLHDQDIVHGNIDPSTIEFLSGVTTDQRVYNEDDEFDTIVNDYHT